MKPFVLNFNGRSWAKLSKRGDNVIGLGMSYYKDDPNRLFLHTGDGLEKVMVMMK